MVTLSNNNSEGMIMKTVTDNHHTGDLWACADCRDVEANGIDSLDWSEQEEADYWASRGEGKVTHYSMGSIEYVENPSRDEDIGISRDEYENQTFSKFPCEVCQSGLGGSRHIMVGWFA